MDLGLKGRVALVCGASQGLGRASAEALAAEGAHVAIVARRKEVVEQVAAALHEKYGVEAFALAADLVGDDACEEVVRKTGERFSRALLARPEVMSRSTASSRASLTTIVETTARSAPARISGASDATR